MAMDLQGKAALVTGGARGLGLQVVKHLLQAGVQKVAVVDMSSPPLKELEAQFGRGKTIFVQTNVTKPDQFKDAFKKTVESFGRLDIVVNNAGVINEKDWELMIDINLTAVVRGTLLAMETMGVDRGGSGGVVVNMASVLGLQALSGCPVYVATKHAVVGLTRSYGLPFHEQRTGVRVVAVCPGVTETPLVLDAERCHPSAEQGRLCIQQLRSMPGQGPESVGPAVVQVLQSAPNGSVWVVEGGQPVYQQRFPPRETLREERAA